jgi:hypothetical protein
MRPVRFVALSEDGQAFVLADEVGRLLALPIDERIHTVLRQEPGGPTTVTPEPVVLSPRDIQAKIRSGESADEVARVAGVPVDRVLRYAGPVLQERAMLAQHARRTKLRGSDKGTSLSLAEVVDARLAQHGVDAEKISWDAYRRDDGTWRIVATWPSGKATAQAAWELDRTRQAVYPHDDMARYLCTERAQPAIGTEPVNDRHGRGFGAPHRGDAGRPDLPGRGELPGRIELPGRGELSGHGRDLPSHSRELPGHGRGDGGRGGHEPMRAPAHDPAARRSSPPARPADPIRSGRDALLASLERPLGAPAEPAARAADPAPQRSAGLAPRPTPASPEPVRPTARPGNLLGGPGSAFDDDVDAPKEVPAVPSLAVLRPRRNGAAAAAAEQPVPTGEKRKRLPSWDDVLFGSAPARESS